MMSERKKEALIDAVVVGGLSILLWFAKVYIAARIFLYVWFHAAYYL